MIQQQVQEISFENVIIKKLEHGVQKNGSMGNWMSLLRAYDEHKLFDDKDKAIKKMHLKFILREDFWIREINRKLELQELKEEDVELIFLAFDDGLYERAANLIYKRLIKLAILQQGQKSSLRQNYIIAKVQKLISLFNRKISFYQGLRLIYQNQKNTRKIRENFNRQIKQAYDDLDITYEEYKLWEKQPQFLQPAQQKYKQAKQKWEERMQANIDQHQLIRDIEEASFFDSISFIKAVEDLPTQNQKLWYLRRVCLQRHQLVCEYLQKLESVHFGQQQIVLQIYKNVIGFSPEAETAYLKFLVRRFNKHMIEQVDDSYSETWGQKVAFFRVQITELIEKKRLTPKTEQSIKQAYYTFWVDVQTGLVKDKDSLCQIFETYLKFNQSVSVFAKYSKCLTKLGFLKDAKQVLKRNCQAFKYDFQALKLYQSFLAIYGSIKDQIQFRKVKNQGKGEKLDQSRLLVAASSSSNGVQKCENCDRKLDKKVHKTNHVQSYKSSPNSPKPEKPNQIIADSNLQFLDFDILNEVSPNHYVSKNQQTKTLKKDESQENHKSPQKKAETQQKINEVPQQKIFKPEHNNDEDQQMAPEKRQRKQQPNSKQENEENSMPRKRAHTDSGCTLFVKGIKQQWDEQKLKSFFKYQDKIVEVRFVNKYEKRQTYCYVEMKSQEFVDKQSEQNEHKDQIYIAKSKPSDSDAQNRTLFLCGLPHSVTEQKISILFEKAAQNIIGLRLKKQQDKCYAYIQFPSINKRNEVLTEMRKNRLTMDDKIVTIKESNVQNKGKMKVAILKNVSFQATEEDIKKFFSHFNLSEVFIPKNDQGRARGFAFIKLIDEVQFQTVLDLKKGYIKGRQFAIQKSERDIYKIKETPKHSESNTAKGNNYFSNLFK